MTEIRLEREANQIGQKAFLPLSVAMIMAFVMIGIRLEICVSQYAALLIMFAIYIIWMINRINGLLTALIFEMTKPLLARIFFGIDYGMNNLPDLDLLGFAPSLILMFMIFSEVSRQYFAREAIIVDRPRRLMIVFIILAVVAIFNPNGSIFVGLAGFQRNILPTMLILFVTASLFKTIEDWRKLQKTLLIAGILSIAYGLLQFSFGILPWEKLWFQKIAFRNDVAGWLTIGFRGIEFRIYSFFYSYAGFFYTNILVFSILFAAEKAESLKWRNLRLLYFGLWFFVLAISMERMAAIMTIASMLVISYLKGTARKKKLIVVSSITTIVAIYISVNLLAPVLAGSGVTKLIRLAEMANPFNASSIEVRRNEIWAPALELIKSHPLGMGLGFGSATIAGGMVQRWSANVQPHNEILQKTLETGLIGGSVYCLLLISLFFAFKKSCDRKGCITNVGAALAGGTAAFMLCGMLNLTFSGTPGILFWALAGAALGIREYNVSICNETKPMVDYADIVQGRLVQDATINNSTANMDDLQQKIK